MYFPNEARCSEEGVRWTAVTGVLVHNALIVNGQAIFTKTAMTAWWAVCTPTGLDRQSQRMGFGAVTHRFSRYAVARVLDPAGCVAGPSKSTGLQQRLQLALCEWAANDRMATVASTLSLSYPGQLHGHLWGLGFLKSYVVPGFIFLTRRRETRRRGLGIS